MARKTYGIDFGTNAIKVYKKGEGIILSERTAVSTVGSKKRAIAIGEKSYDMFEKAPESIHVSLPLSRGVVSELDDMVSLWDFMGKKITGKRTLGHCRFYIAVPADITEVEKQAYSKIITQSETKAKKVCLIDKPIADAYGLGMDIERLRGLMIVNIGADTTEISVLSLGGIVVSKLLPYGGNDFDKNIQNYIKKQYHFMIGLKTAEHVKKALVSTEVLHDEVTVAGRDVIRGLPQEITIEAEEIYPLTRDIFSKMASETRSMLEHTPPEISSDIRERGIFLTGGTSLIAGLDQYFANQVNIRVNTTSYAEKTVAKGIGYLSEHPKDAERYAVPLEI